MVNGYFWRLGLSIHSPTFYTLNDKFQTDITTNAENGSIQTDYSIDYNNGEPAEFKYSLITPYKIIGSVSYVIREIQDVRKQRGFLTADVEYINYKSSSFTPHEEETTDEGYYKGIKCLLSHPLRVTWLMNTKIRIYPDEKTKGAISALLPSIMEFWYQILNPSVRNTFPAVFFTVAPEYCACCRR